MFFFYVQLKSFWFSKLGGERTGKVSPNVLFLGRFDLKKKCISLLIRVTLYRNRLKTFHSQLSL